MEENSRVRSEIVRSRTGLDSIVATGEQLVRDVVLHLTKQNLHMVQQDQISICMRECVTKVLDKHEILFNSFVSRLNGAEGISEDVFLTIANELFMEGGVTWSRIIALYALAGRLAIYCHTNNRLMLNIGCKIPQSMVPCITSKIAPFVRKNGGWIRLCEEFPIKEDMTNKIWLCLLVTGAGLGLAAVLLAKYMPVNSMPVTGRTLL
ncbi:hypothetical protein C0J52_06958 [Blattella germanica]|nr:hypothetical protein C0J52_06958 [Blattella germanica]